MKLIKVKCPKNKIVEVEDLGTGAAKCPTHCPMKSRSRCFNNTFRYSKALKDTVAVDVFYGGEKSDVSKGGTAVPYASSRLKESPSSSEKITPTTAKESATGRTDGFSSTRARTPIREISEEPTERKGISTIGYDTSFFDEDEESAPSTIGYDTSFLDDDEEDEYLAKPTEKSKVGSSKADKIGKYNDGLVSDSSLFARVRERNINEPCFVDGGNVFYERAPVGVRSQGNASTAIRYVFQHWYVSRVFEEDGKTYRENFLYLLKLQRFQEKEEELRAIAEDVKLSVNGKFFKLFYEVIYKNQLNAFFFSEKESPFVRLSARFLDRSDFYKKLITANDPEAFLRSFEPCFDELISFLSAGKVKDGQREWVKRHIPLSVAEITGQIIFVDETDGKFTVTNLGRIRDFVNNLTKPVSIEEMRMKYKFLQAFSITLNYKLTVRTTALELSSKVRSEDDGIYELLGLRDISSSQCATAYNYYVTLAREYVDVFHPTRLELNGHVFFFQNFYAQVLETVVSACMHLTEGAGYRQNVDVKKFYLVKSLFERGVFDYFEKGCETDKLRVLKRAFFESDDLDLSTYFSFEGITHWIMDRGEKKTVSDYLAENVLKGRHYMLEFQTDKILNAYVSAKVNAEELKIAFDEIDNILANAQRLVDKL